jgi:hypothetical protein
VLPAQAQRAQYEGYLRPTLEVAIPVVPGRANTILRVRRREDIDQLKTAEGLRYNAQSHSAQWFFADAAGRVNSLHTQTHHERLSRLDLHLARSQDNNSCFVLHIVAKAISRNQRYHYNRDAQ